MNMITSTSAPILVVRGLEKTYGGRKVVAGVSFDVRPGEIVGLLGKNGAGKSTSFRMTNGLVRPEAGEVQLEGQDVSSWPLYRRARAGMGYLPQDASVFRGLTVAKNLMAVLEFTEPSRAKRTTRRDELIEEFGLGKVRDSLAQHLSGGERRRLEIARCLVPRPKIILLDEPFSGIDPIAVADIQDIISRLKDRGIAILLTDHNVRETLLITDRTYIIEEGRILASGTPDEILDDPRARAAYLGERFYMDLGRERAAKQKLEDTAPEVSPDAEEQGQ